MANQSITSGTVNYDAASIGGLLNGEQVSISGGATLVINADTQWAQQAAALGNVAIDTTSGGGITIDGSQLWEVPFSAATGNVPTLAALGSNTVTGATSGATGELIRVWASGSLIPATAGGAMPASGYIKLRSRTGTFQSGETINIPGGATITAASAGKRSWMQVMQSLSGTTNLHAYAAYRVDGDWYEIGTTQGLDDEIIQTPFTAPIYGIQIETGPGTGVYEWWANASNRMGAYAQQAYFGTNTTNGSVTTTLSRPTAFVEPYGFQRHPATFRETTANGIHEVFITSGAINAGVITGRAYIKRDTRQWGFVTLLRNDNARAYGVVIDLTTGAVTTTISLGSPTNVSSSVTAMGDDWYRVDVSASAAELETWTVRAGPSDSATPTLSQGRPTYTGVATQGILVMEVHQFAAPNITWVATDARGKFFGFNAINGQIRLAVRTGRSNGMKPPAGCRVRVANVCLGRSDSRDWNNDALVAPTARVGGSNATLSVRFCNCTSLNLAPAAGFTFENASFFNEVGNPTFSIAKDSSFDGGVITFFMENAAQFGCRNNIGKLTMRNFRIVADNNFGVLSFSFANLSGLTLDNVEGFWFPDRARQAHHQLNTCITFNDVSNATITNLKVVGGQLVLQNTKNSNIDGLSFANVSVGVTSTVYTSYAARLFNVTNLSIRDFKAYEGIANLHPTLTLFESNTTNGTATNVTIRDIGTRAAPYDMGPVSTRCGSAAVIVGSDIKLYRLHFTHGGSLTINGTQTALNGYNFTVQDVVTSTGTTAGYSTGLTIRRGIRGLTPDPSSTNLYGFHMDDTFVDDTRGRITLFCNDAVPATADQFSVTSGSLGTTGSSSLLLSRVGDTATWTMPYYSLGHTGIAKFLSGASATETWRLFSLQPENYEATYQIDTGSGFGAAKWMLSVGKQASGGAAGTNTVTINTTDWNAMTRKPAVGDFVQSINANITAGTTITNVAGQTLTLSANIVTTIGSGSVLYFWKDIAQETIDPATGFRLRVILRAVSAVTSTVLALTHIRIPTDTTLAAQTNNLYPIPTLQVTNLQPLSRVKVKRVDTNAILAQKASGAGTTVDFELSYAGLVEVEARNASGTPAYQPWVTRTNVTLSAVTTVVALQQPD